MPYKLVLRLRADHQEAEGLARRMVDTDGTVHELRETARAFERAAVIHEAAQARTFELVSSLEPKLTPDLQHWINSSRGSHRLMTALVGGMGQMVTGSSMWYESALELQTIIANHAFYEDRLLADIVMSKGDLLSRAAAGYLEERQLRTGHAHV